MAVLYKNNAASTLASGINTTATSIVLASGGGAKFPAVTGSDFFYLTILDGGGNFEIVKVTARTIDTLTVVRAQEGTTAISFVSGVICELRITGGLLDQFKSDTATSITSSNVTNALGFTPYNASNPSGYITGITSGNVTTALGFTPYNATNPSGYISGITSANVTTALGYTPYNSTNPSGYITGITSGMVTTALGFTPYNNSNPSGYITSSALSGYLTSASAASTYLPLAGGTLTGNLAITTVSTNGYNTAIFQGNWNGAGYWGLGSDGIHTIKFDQINTLGGTQAFAGASDITLKLGTKTVLDSSNYNSYAPTLTGTGASGTWNINITGTAATATSAPNYLPLAGGTLTGVTLVKRNLGTNDYTNVGQHNLHLRLQRSSDLKTLELGVLDNGTGVIQANEAGVGYQTLALNPVTGSVTANGSIVLHAGNYTSYAATAGHNHTYDVNNAWLRDANDDANVKLYGNTRQMVFRTDGTTEFASGVGPYAFAWMYGGDSSSNRRMLLTDAGRLWTNTHGWMDEAFAPLSHVHSYLPLSGGTVTGATKFTGSIGNSPALSPPGVWVGVSAGNDGQIQLTGASPHIDFANADEDFDIRIIREGDDTLGIRGGWLEVDSSVRTPIFYDSNDTSYYADLNGQNFMRYLRIAGDWGGSVDTAQLGIRGTYPSVTFRSSTSNSVWLRHMDGAGDIQHYYASGGLDGNGWSVRHYMTSGGTFGSIGDHRAPIFYDSNDTSWYVDPHANSRLNQLGVGSNNTSFTFYNNGTSYLNGAVTIDDTASFTAGNQLQFYTSAGSLRGYINVTDTDDNHFQIATSGGEDIVFKDSGLSGTRNLVIRGSNAGTEAYGSMRSPIFYDSNDTAYFVDPNSSGTCFKGYGTVDSRVGFTSIGNPWGTSNSAYFPNGITTAGGTNWIYGFSYIGNAPSNGAGHEFNTDGSMRSTGSHRASVYYDDNNTAYYIDPANGGFNLLSGVATLLTNNSGFKVTNAEGNGVADVRLGAAWGAPGVYSSSSIYLMSEANVFFKIGNADKGYMDSSSNLFAYGSMRSPIFYDSNDTAYYVNPNGVSNLSNLTVGNYIQTQAYPGVLITGNPSYNYNFLNGSWTSSITAGYLANCADQWEMAIHDSGERVVSALFFQGGPSNNYILMGRDIGWGTTYVQAQQSFRAPIFYDSNDTSYYLDAASTSVFNRISTVRTNDWLYIDNNYGHSVVGVYESTRYQGVFAMGNSYKLPADGTTTGNLYGIAWSHPNAGGAAGNLNTHGALFLENGSFMAAISGSIRCRDDMRAPIYYDRNDTAYYTDPNGTSRMADIHTNRIGVGQGVNASWPLIVSGNAYLNAGGYGQAEGSWRAPIFYDSEDTGFYCNPNATSRFSTLRTTADIYISSGSPTIHFVDANERGAALHCNSNLLYILSSDGVGGESWTTNNGQWPFYINLNSNDATFGGAISAAGNITAYSDIKLKENIETVDNALDKVLKLRGVYYTLKRDELQTRRVGVVAQEIQEVLPEVVELHKDAEDTEGTLTVAYGNITGLLIEAMKEQNQEVVDLRNRVAQLESLIHKLIGD